MRLTLTTSSPSDAVYTSEDGVPQYKVASVPLLKKMREGRSIKVSKVVDADIPRAPSRGSATSSQPEGGGSAEAAARYARLATIDLHVVDPSVIRFAGREREVLMRDFFRKEGWGWYGRHRVFTAQDGKEYKWILGAYTCYLQVNDASEKPVARFRPAKFGIFSKKRPASLEIYEGFEELLDEIMVTFVFIEHIRKTKERAARSPVVLNK
ncbi:hypothetical protein MKEN_01358500 [Mycena kentingensis (nom. inval.)]|nr:hypothetical protein MKEN_01358500 [Mycena kentingensis (nom. inval.)]